MTEGKMQDHETQASIGQWADQTFGASSIKARWLRVCQEVDETTKLLRGGKSGPLSDEAPGRAALAEELADVAITLYGLAHTAGIDLQAAVDLKMAINRARRWQRHGDGTGQHIEGGSK
jgi:NTP pyrophosphatase (non-canonical NTP hydrolase)